MADVSRTALPSHEASTDNMTGLQTILSTFIKPQERDLPQAIAELRRGRKTSHWIWWIFPQMLPSGAHQHRGVSQRAFDYRIQSPMMASAYLRHSVLGRNYIDAVSVVAETLRTQQHHALVVVVEGYRGLASCGALVLMGSSVDLDKLYMSLSTFVLAMISDNTLRSEVKIHQQHQERINGGALSGGGVPLATVVDEALLRVLLSVWYWEHSTGVSKSYHHGSTTLLPTRPAGLFLQASFLEREQLLMEALQIKGGVDHDAAATDRFNKVMVAACHAGVREAWVVGQSLMSNPLLS